MILKIELFQDMEQFPYKKKLLSILKIDFFIKLNLLPLNLKCNQQKRMY